MNLESLRPYCDTCRQEEILDAYIQHGTIGQAARALRVNHKTVSRSIQRLRVRAARQGWSPEHDMKHPVPEGFTVKGVSTLYGPEGDVRGQWVKSREDAEARERQIQALAEGLSEDLPRIQPLRAPKALNGHLMSVYPWGDPHFGMYAWGDECGDDWDIDKARELHCSAVDYLVSQSPESERGVIIILGDLFHADNMAGVTERSRNVLDMDTRMPKVVQVGVSAIRQCIESAREKHRQVEVIVASGNHDDLLSRVIAIMLANIYEREPRITVYDQPTPRHYIRHGRVLIGVTHGHMTKDPQLPGIMAAERPEDWGQTKHRYFYRGHHHHDSLQEYNGCIVEQFRTLAAGDSYAVASGYLAGRDMKCIIHHKEYGEVARSTCAVDMLR